MESYQCPYVNENGETMAPKTIPSLKILLAVDGSPHAAAAANLLTHMAWPDSTAAHILAVTPESVSRSGPTTIPPYRVEKRGIDPYLRNWVAIQSLAKRVADQLQTHHLTTNIDLYSGRPTSVILTRSEELSVDLVVVGAKGLNAPAELQLGSTAKRLTDCAPHSLLVARPARYIRPLRTLLVVHDSAATWRAVRFLCTLFPCNWANITVVSLVPAITEVPAGVIETAPAPIPRLGGRQSPAYVAETCALKIVAHLHTCDTQGQITIRVGPPAEEVLTAAQEYRADLIVIGTHLESPSHPWNNWNDVIQTVVKEATCSILLIR